MRHALHAHRRCIPLSCIPLACDDVCKNVVPAFDALCLLSGQEQARTSEHIGADAFAIEVDEILKHELDGLNSDCLCDDWIQVRGLRPALFHLHIHLPVNPAADASLGISSAGYDSRWARRCHPGARSPRAAEPRSVWAAPSAVAEQRREDQLSRLSHSHAGDLYTYSPHP